MSLTGIVDGYAGWNVSFKTNDGVSQIELRKKFGREGSLLLIVGAEGKGYNHKFYLSNPDRRWRNTLDYDMHWASNGPLQLTFSDLDEIYTVARKSTNGARTEICIFGREVRRCVEAAVRGERYLQDAPRYDVRADRYGSCTEYALHSSLAWRVTESIVTCD